jgi:hypothetical protein
MVRRRAADPLRPGICAGPDRGGGRLYPGRASGLRARGRRGAGRGQRVAHAAAGVPGRLLRLGAGGPDARRRSRPAAIYRACGAGRFGQAQGLSVLHRRARGPDRGAVAAPRRAPYGRGHLRLHVAGAARAAAPPAGAPPAAVGHLHRHRRAGDHGRLHGERRPVRRRAHPSVAGHAAAAHPAGRTRDAAGAGLPACVRHGDDAGANVLPRIPSRPGGTRRAVVGRHPAGRSGVPAQRRGVRRRAPPPRATLGPSRDRPRPGRPGRPLRRGQRRGPLRAQAGPGHPGTAAPAHR